MRVRYRFWPTNDFHTGTVVDVRRNVLGEGVSVDIKRDGYRETAVLPIEKFLDPQLVTRIDHSGKES